MRKRRRLTKADYDACSDAWAGYQPTLNLFAANGGVAPGLCARHMLLSFARECFAAGFLAARRTAVGK